MKNRTKGFTLIEIVIALGILIIISGLVITTITSIHQARMRHVAQIIKSEFELTRNFAKTHGGNIDFMLKKTAEGILVVRTGETVITEETLLEDKNLSVFYKETGNDKEYQLGVKDANDVVDGTIVMTFSQTQGAIIGPNMIDYIVVSNGSKNYKLIIKQDAGMMYYDYELESANMNENVVDNKIIYVTQPSFVRNGALVNTVAIQYTGSSVQPELSYDARYIKIGGVYRAIEPKDEYVITFTLKDPYTTKWDDGTVGPKTLVWAITKEIGNS
jgi:type II secretory pathway pseudopilin PulG